MLSLLAVVAHTFLLSADGPIHFPLNAGAPVWDVAVEDVDGDGLNDVVALCATRDGSERFVAVFPMTPSGRMLASPLIRHSLDDTAGVAFFAEVDGVAPRELVTAHHGGANIFRLDGETYEPVHERTFVSSLPTATREPRFLPSAAFDLDHDGREEWLIPAPAGYLIVPPSGEPISLPSDADSEMRVYGLPYMTHRPPAIHTYQPPGEDALGVACLSDRFADFFHGPGWGTRERVRLPEALDDTWDKSTRLSDFNNDGLLDLLVTQTKGTANLEVLTQIFMSRDRYEYASEPDTTIKNKGALSTPMLRDVNNDKGTDLVFVTVPFGVRSIVNYFLRGKFTVKAEVHLFDADTGSVALDPAFDKTFTLDAPEGREQVAYAMGDFTGDGLMDAALGVREDEIAVYAGDADDFLDGRATTSVAVPGFGIARGFSIGHTKADDLVVWHPNSAVRTTIDVILF